MLGGTRFIGRASVEELARAGHDVLVVHRGQLEPPELGHLEHLHADRAEFASQRAALRDFKADAVLDCIALTRNDADHAKQALPDAYHWVILSSMDVYRAYGALMAGTQSDRVPLDESSPVRTERYPYRDRGGDLADYDKLDVEDAFAERNATILRFPMVHGERDRQRREEFILRRVRAGRLGFRLGRTWLTCLRWRLREPSASRGSVRWHLANPPTDPDPGFEADDAALAAATSASRAS